MPRSLTKGTLRRCPPSEEGGSSMNDAGSKKSGHQDLVPPIDDHRPISSATPSPCTTARSSSRSTSRSTWSVTSWVSFRPRGPSTATRRTRRRRGKGRWPLRKLILRSSPRARRSKVRLVADLRCEERTWKKRSEHPPVHVQEGSAAAAGQADPESPVANADQKGNVNIDRLYVRDSDGRRRTH